MILLILVADGRVTRKNLPYGEGYQLETVANTSYAEKYQGLTLKMRWKLESLSTVGAEGISGEAVKCRDIGKNTNNHGESTQLWADTDTDRQKLG